MAPILTKNTGLRAQKWKHQNEIETLVMLSQYFHNCVLFVSGKLPFDLKSSIKVANFFRTYYVDFYEVTAKFYTYITKQG